MLKKNLLVILLFIAGFLLSGCGEVQSDYYEVHIVVVGDALFHYVNPDEGKDTISVKYMDNEDSQFIYLYQNVDGIEFSYDQFFTTINARFITTDRRTGKHYILVNDDIDTRIQQYYVDKEAWVPN
jgi:hypothetical protein